MKRMLFWVAMAATAMTSCSKNEPIETTKSEAIGFGTYVGLSTKGADASLTSLQADGFTVNGYFTEKNWMTNGAAALPEIMYQAKVTYHTTAWKYTPLAFWPASGTVSFFANSTHDAVTAPSDATKEGVPSFTFTAADAAVDQIDCLAAVALDKEKSNGTVNFAFNHILSKIGFTAILNDEPDAGTTVKVTNLVVNYAQNKVKNSGTYTHKTDGTVGLWSDVATPTYHSETVGAGGDVINEAGEVTMSTTAAQLNADNKFLMIVPQTLATEGDMSVDITYTVQVDGGVVLTYTKTANIPATTFAPITSYLFNIVIDLAGDAIKFNDPSFITWLDGGSIATS